MSKKRILTIINIVLSVVLIIGVFLPITTYNLFSYPNIRFLSPFIIIVLSIASIIVNAINKKVEITYVTSGFTFLYMLDFGWQIYNGFNIGFYILLIASFLMLLSTIIYGLFDNVSTNKSQNNYIRPNYDNINKYHNVQMAQNMNVPYQNQMMYPNNQGYYRR